MSPNRADDLRMLRELAVCEVADDDEDDVRMSRAGVLSRKDAAAFKNMLWKMTDEAPTYLRLGELTEKQRRYVAGVYERVTGTPTYENLVSSGKVGLGSYGKTPKPAVLLAPLPKKPPGRS